MIAAREKIEQNISGTSFSIKDFMTTDDDGNVTAVGVYNMFDAIKELYGDQVYSVDENGLEHWDFKGMDEEISEKLGLDISFFQKALQAALDSNFNIDFDSSLLTLEQLQKNAESAKNSLTQLDSVDSGTSIKNIDLETSDFDEIASDMDSLNNYIDEINDSDSIDIDVKEDEISKANDMLAYLQKKLEETYTVGDIDISKIWDESEVDDRITSIKDKLNSLKDSDGKLNMDDSDVQSLMGELEFMLELKNELNQPTIAQIDTSNVETETGTLIDLLNDYHNKVNELNNLSAQKDFDPTIDTTEAENSVNNLKQQIDNYNPEIKVGIGLSEDTSSLSVDDLYSKINGLSVQKILEFEPQLSEDPDFDEAYSEVHYEVDKSAGDEYKANCVAGLEDAYAKVKYTIEIENTEALNSLPTTINASTSKNSSASGSQSVNGTAHISGTAHASGNWGTKKTETALVGELGREILVDGNTGTWQTIGDNGAEFRRIPANSIIFNHKQTEDLLKNGYVTSRGKTVKGSSWLSGNAYSSASGGGRDLLNKAMSLGGGSSTEATESASEAASSASEAASSASEAAESASEATEEFSEMVDWIETKIDRIERVIENIGTIAESEFNTYSKRNDAVMQKMSKLNEEISIQQQAYDRYMQQANSVGLSEDYAQKVRDGLIDIEEITDEDLKDKIDDYQEWLTS